MTSQETIVSGTLREKRSNPTSKTIYLGWRNNHPLTVSEEGYEAIVALIAHHQVCSEGCRYSQSNPMVAENTCLACLRKKQPELTFLAPLGGPDQDGYQQFSFITDYGYVYLSNTRYADEAKQDSYQTLVHWQFPVPSLYKTLRGEEVTLYPHSWRVYGDFRASVVVIERSYDQKHTATFLSYKNGETRELSKRDGDTKRLLEQAEDIIKESKDESGYYYYSGSSSRQIRDYWLYEVVSQIASAVYDVKLRLAATNPAPEQAAQHEEGLAS